MDVSQSAQLLVQRLDVTVPRCLHIKEVVALCFKRERSEVQLAFELVEFEPFDLKCVHRLLLQLADAAEVVGYFNPDASFYFPLCRDKLGGLPPLHLRSVLIAQARCNFGFVLPQPRFNVIPRPPVRGSPIATAVVSTAFDSPLRELCIDEGHFFFQGNSARAFVCVRWSDCRCLCGVKPHVGDIRTVSFCCSGRPRSHRCGHSCWCENCRSQLLLQDRQCARPSEMIEQIRFQLIE